MTVGTNMVRPIYKGPDGQEDMPYLLTPGPLTTSRAVKLAMLADWGSRDPEFRQIIRSIRSDLLRLAQAGADSECVLMQGSGTFAIEAALGSFAPGRGRKTLVLVNGNYGERAVQILEHIKRPYSRIDTGDSAPIVAEDVAAALDGDPDIQLVFLVHCETTSGIINPLKEVARAVKLRGRILMVDAMSSFGALPVSMAEDGIDVLVSSSNKCIEGVPGFSYALCRRDLLDRLGRTLPFGGARSQRPVDGAGKNRPVPLHPADPCARRLCPGAQGTRGGGRHRGPAQALQGEPGHPRPGDEADRLRPLARGGACRPDHPDLSQPRRIRASISRCSTAFCGRAALPSIPAS